MQVLERKLSSVTPTFRNPALGSQLTQRIARDFTPRWDQQWGGKFVLHGKPAGSNAIRLDGNDYLSVTGHPSIVQAQVDALRKERPGGHPNCSTYGQSNCSTLATALRC